MISTDNFDARELAEIKFARHYASNPHGTDGHHRLMLISKLYDMLIESEREHRDSDDPDQS